MDGNYREAFQKSDELFEVGNYETPLYQQLSLCCHHVSPKIVPQIIF